MPKDWPHRTQRDLVSQGLWLQAKRWRSEDLKFHEIEAAPAFEAKIGAALRGRGPYSKELALRMLAYRLNMAFGIPPYAPYGISLLKPGEVILPKHLKGAWNDVYGYLRSLIS